jgi:hypothetical protein
MPDEKSRLQEDSILADADLRRHVRAVAQGQELVVSACCEEKAGQLQGMRSKHVIISKAVDEHQGPGQVGCKGQQAAAVVRRSIRFWMTQITLGVSCAILGRCCVARGGYKCFGQTCVIKAPLGHWRPSNRGVKHVGHFENSQSSEVAAEGPTNDADSAGINVFRVESGQRSHGGRLVFKRR